MDDSERLRMSKKRDHKIMITEEAIRKVPLFVIGKYQRMNMKLFTSLQSRFSSFQRMKMNQMRLQLHTVSIRKKLYYRKSW